MTNENKLTLNERKQKMEIRAGENNKRENDIEKKNWRVARPKM